MSSGDERAGEEVSRLIKESGCGTSDLARAMNTEAKTISRWKHRRVDPPSYAPAAVKWALLILGKTIRVKP
jgi:DNA-binding transcriptional regulator YiaG